MGKLDNITAEYDSIAIVGHINPDGDCTGACLAACNYLKKQNPEKTIRVYLGDFSDTFLFLQGADEISHDFAAEEDYDLCLSIDTADLDRLGEGKHYFERAKRTICIDHHISNQGFADENYVDAKASAASELLYTMMDEEKIDLAVAECLYMGIVHDTGVFKHSNTTEQTMAIAGKLVAKGVNTSDIIDGTFYRKTYVQNLLLGTALCRSKLALDGECIYTWLDQKDLNQYNAGLKDADGIVDQLRLTEGVECAVFLTERGENLYKLSLRSNNWLNVSELAASHGGGGHIRAAGCQMNGTVESIMDTILSRILEQRERK